MGEVKPTRHSGTGLAHGEERPSRPTGQPGPGVAGVAAHWYWRRGLVEGVVAAMFILGAMLVLAGTALPRQLDHDEHQFVASGVLLARNGLLPYLDYPYFHLPNLVFLYAAVDLVAASPLLAARFVSLGFALVTLCLVWFLVWRSLSGSRSVVRIGMAGAAVVMSALSPLSFYTVGRAWNHDAAVAMFLLAFALTDAARHRPPGFRILAGGLACGLAVGTRLSFAPAAVGLLLLVVLWTGGDGGRGRGRTLGLFALGAGLGLLPTFVLAARAPDAFVFGNLTYTGLNQAYRAATGFTTAMDLEGKVRFIFQEILVEPRNAILFVSLVVLLTADALRVLTHRKDGSPQSLAIGALLPLLLLGALAPTPSWYQYFYLLVPFAAIAATIAAGRLHILKARIPIGAAWMILAAFTVIWFSRGEIRSVRRLLTPQSWTSVVVHRVGERIADLTGEGPVLTLSPIYVLEGGGSIYEQLATGPFAWRVGSFVPVDRRERLHVVTADELAGVLTSRPPAGILVGKEADLEGPMTAFARANGFEAVDVGDELTLWVR